jgi:ABC-type lipoprotein export system ATPase subunit
MITRVYANNFRCLVAFEAELESFGVLCGPNGAGKSSVFDVVKLIRDLGTSATILGGDGPHDIKQLEFTNWLQSTIQEFEVDVISKGRKFEYLIHIEQAHGDVKPRIIEESASCDGRLLFSRDLEGVTFDKKDGRRAGFPLDWRQAALGAIQPAGTLSEIEILQKALGNILILRTSPRSMEVESRGESQQPSLSLSNILSWYRSLSQEQEWTDALRNSLQDVWPDFKSFKLVDVGLNSKSLQLRFGSEQGREPGPYYFHQLSDGEKSLVGLYMVRAAMETSAANILFIDEPDNYIGLPELQPWVLALRELLDENHQAILISHHPEVLDSAGEEFGKYLWRDNHNSPTRIGPLKVPEGITAGEAIARGWANG